MHAVSKGSASNDALAFAWKDGAKAQPCVVSTPPGTSLGRKPHRMLSAFAVAWESGRVLALWLHMLGDDNQS